MNLHTPGPWTFDADTGEICCPGYLIAAVDDSEGSISPDQFAANARLIATAPELLEALEEMLEVQSRRRHPLGAPDEGIAGTAASAASKARSAITKAKGGAA